MLIYSANIGVLVTIIPLYSKYVGADNISLGFIVSAYALAFVVASLFWGKASDIFGRKIALSLGMLVYSVAVFLFALARNPSQIMLIRLLQGFADAAFWTVPAALVTDFSVSQELGKALGKVGTIQAAGLIVGPILGSVGIEKFDYSSVFYMCSAFTFLTALIIYFGVQEKTRVARMSSEVCEGASSRSVKMFKSLFSINFVDAVLSGVFFGVIVSQFIVYSKTKLETEGAYLAGCLMASYYAVEAFVRSPIGKLTDAIGHQRVVVLGFVICAIGFSILIFASSFVSLLIAIVVIGGGIGAVTTALTASFMGTASSTQRGFAAGFQNIAWGTGYFLGSIIGGVVVGYYFGAPYLLCTIGSVFGGAATILAYHGGPVSKS